MSWAYAIQQYLNLDAWSILLSYHLTHARRDGWINPEEQKGTEQRVNANAWLVSNLVKLGIRSTSTFSTKSTQDEKSCTVVFISFFFGANDREDELSCLTGPRPFPPHPLIPPSTNCPIPPESSHPWHEPKQSRRPCRTHLRADHHPHRS